MKYTDEMTAACLDMTVEQYRAKFCGAAGKEQNRLACSAVRSALAGDTKGATKALALRAAKIKAA